MIGGPCQPRPWPPPWGADGCSEAAALWEGTPAKQPELPAELAALAPGHLVPRSRAFSWVQEVTSPSAHGACVRLDSTLSPRPFP